MCDVALVLRIDHARTQMPAAVYLASVGGEFVDPVRQMYDDLNEPPAKPRPDAALRAALGLTA